MEQKESWLDAVTNKNVKIFYKLIGWARTDDLKLIILPNGEKGYFLETLDNYGQFDYAYYIFKDLEVLYKNSSFNGSYRVKNNKLIPLPENFISITYGNYAENWFRYLNIINSGRKINGKTFEEALSEIIYKDVDESYNKMKESANEYLDSIFGSYYTSNVRRKK